MSVHSSRRSKTIYATAVFVAASAAGCDVEERLGDPDPTVPSSDGGRDDARDGGVPVSRCDRFDGAQRPWALPSGFPRFERIGGRDFCGGGSTTADYEWTTVDLDGDGQLDLVVTNGCGDDDPAGRDHWLRYAGTTGGFAPRPMMWALPSTGFPRFDTIGGRDFCGGGSTTADYEWTTVDLDGDGQLDLVVTNGCCDDDPAGRDHWLVYAGTTGGFASRPTMWALPSTGFPRFDTIGGRDFCGGGSTTADYEWTTVDLDGDGRLDLVVTNGCGNDAPAGRDHWLVYAGTTGGFASRPTMWALPSTGFPRFDTIGGRDFCGGGSTTADYEWTTVDLDGDGRLDLVVTNGCGDDDPEGRDHWLVYAGTTGGFAPIPTRWALPSTGFPRFERIGGRDFCGGGSTTADYEWTTVDLDGDGRLDLVVTNGCGDDDPAGRDHWLVYAGTTGGFAPGPTMWALPSTGFPRFERIGGRDFCGGGSTTADYEWTTVDLDGDGRLDLVVTNGCGDDASAIGVDRWLTFSCATGP